LSHLDIGNHSLNALRHVLLAAPEHTDIDNHEPFMDYVREQMHGDLPANLHGNTLKLPYRDTLTPEDALSLWNETVSAYQVAHLELEIKELQESIGQSLDEAVYLRVVELQQALQKAHGARTFAPATTEPDAA